VIQNRYRIRRARLESVLFRARLGGQESRIKPQFDHGRLEACRRKPCHCKKICYFFLQVRQPVTDRSTEEKALRRIHSNGEGWAFSARDFADMGSRPTIDSALHRLERKGSIRRIIRGVYDRPQFSETLSTELKPRPRPGGAGARAQVRLENPTERSRRTEPAPPLHAGSRTCGLPFGRPKPLVPSWTHGSCF